MPPGYASRRITRGVRLEQFGRQPRQSCLGTTLSISSWASHQNALIVPSVAQHLAIRSCQRTRCLIAKWRGCQKLDKMLSGTLLRYRSRDKQRPIHFVKLPNPIPRRWLFSSLGLHFKSLKASFHELPPSPIVKPFSWPTSLKVENEEN